jgi:ketosteroid isomerase-like protein
VTATDAAVFAQSNTGNEIQQWLTEFAQCVRDEDYAAGRQMFAEDTVSFGSVSEILEGLDQLESRQWRRVWGVTRGFDFDYGSMRCATSGETGWAVALWSSEGGHQTGWFQREGRATFILEKRDGRWLAVHSHFSLVPAPTV